ncbi:MAG: hypothetical protein IJK58_06575 [Clostridia bacterium]|nr:hypothetical protein [Clostridia bacterium]
MDKHTDGKVIKKEIRNVGGFLDAEYTLSAVGDHGADGSGRSYSVRASVTDLRTGLTDVGTILDVTRDRAFAERVFSLVVNGGVTPVALSGVISDILSDPDKM